MPTDQEVQENQVQILKTIKETELDTKIVLMEREFTIGKLMSLIPGAILMFDGSAGESADLCVNGRKVATGEVVQVNENYGLRVTELMGS